jgi:hypothetical protein
MPFIDAFFPMRQRAANPVGQTSVEVLWYLEVPSMWVSARMFLAAPKHGVEHENLSATEASRDAFLMLGRPCRDMALQQQVSNFLHAMRSTAIYVSN